MKKGFTLIELLIVVAIIAILAAIAVPNFLEAQTRAKVSRVKNDLRSVATALESYFVDYNMYIPSATSFSGTDPLDTVSASLTDEVAADRLTFATYQENNDDQRCFSMTTPISFMSSVPSDPFADTKGSAFGYWNAKDMGWIMWSYGPNGDETTRGEIESFLFADQVDAYSWYPAMSNGGSIQNSLYNPYLSNPTETLVTGATPDNIDADLQVDSTFTYDPTNGTTSPGDVWRIKD